MYLILHKIGAARQPRPKKKKPSRKQVFHSGTEKCGKPVLRFCAEKPKKGLTEWKMLYYTITLQALVGPCAPMRACPCMSGAGTKAKAPAGGQVLGGQQHEKNVSAQEAPAQPCPRFPRPHEQQEWPQGHQRPPCEGPQEPDRLIGRRAFGPQN